MQILIRSGKGKKTRYSLLGQRTVDLLRDYWKRYRPHDFLFPGQIHSKPLSERTVEVVFKQAMKLAKINKPAYFHCFFRTLPVAGLRHSENTRMNATNADTDSIPIILAGTVTAHPHIHLIIPAGGLSEDRLKRNGNLPGDQRKTEVAMPSL